MEIPSRLILLKEEDWMHEAINKALISGRVSRKHVTEDERGTRL
jgi:hypothetical protein